MRTRMSGGVGRVVSNGDPYPIVDHQPTTLLEKRREVA